MFGLHFNSHAHVERDYLTGSLTALYTNFNSHAHVERDEYNKNCIDEINISTHTLTWSVTLSIPHNTGDDTISTHTLTWSVTESRRMLRNVLGFQLTRSRGA